MNKNKHRHFLSALGATVVSAALALSLSACGSSDSSSTSTDSSSSSSDSSSSSNTLTALNGVSATGTQGKKLKVSIKKPLTIKSNSYKVLQEGNGAALKDGQRLCTQSVTYNARTGEELNSTWKSGADCSITLDSNITAAYLKVFKQQKINSAIAFGIPATASSTASSSETSTTDAYVTVMTITSATTDPTKASGTKVTDIPSSLPKVSLAASGAPSISKAELKKYKATKKLVVQTLIKGKGAKVKSSNNVRAQYTGWLLNGTQFDSSWKSGTPLDFALSSGVIKGWTQGLEGQTVGSQVLLIIPPSLGYGNQAQGSIPKNSTLVFVVDILAAY